MSRARDITEDAGALLLCFLAIKIFSGWRSEPWWTPEYTNKGGRGAGRGRTKAPVPQGSADVWSEETMRLFDQQMRLAGIDPAVVLLGIGAASHFSADTQLGNTTGLLLVDSQQLRDLGYPEEPAFETLDAPAQIPWIAKVIAYRISSTGRVVPKDVPELAVLLHPASPTVTEVIRSEARRRAAEAEGSMLYIHHANLLRHVQANP